MATTLTAATYDDAHAFWEGGNYELNITFDTLRDRQWQQVVQTLWEHPSLNGPLSARHSPGQPPAGKQAIQAPPPTAALIQHGQLAVESFIVGCDVQATRSLFECVSILIPLGMFANIESDSGVRARHPELHALDLVFYDIALAVYDAAPFQVAAIGFERSCQLITELKTDFLARHNFLVSGNFLAQERILAEIEPDLSGYQEVRPGLRWMPAKY
ncbi:MAG TPA: hypothetical protein PLD47_13330 [Aggregatilineales bacterium]|nr:hypothetical protein [Anaerolineales bacterium]HRE48701.1 hypothetical protein [Aggregatilineales bacterium]